VLDLNGKLLTQSVRQTEAATIRDFLRGLSGNLLLTFEEGTLAQWLFDLRRPLVAEVLVCNPRENHSLTCGSKNDRIDALNLVTWLRAGLLTPVFHGSPKTQTWKQLAHTYDALTEDATRTMNRLKAVYRSQAIKCSGRDVSYTRHREAWLAKLKEVGLRLRAGVLYAPLDDLRGLRREAKKAMLKEARPQRAFKQLSKVPGVGPIRVAQIICRDFILRRRLRLNQCAYNQQQKAYGCGRNKISLCTFPIRISLTEESVRN
jgi:hypothetical protein